MNDKEIIAVIGSGTMGNGIAHISALSGYSVYLVDINNEFLDKAIKELDLDVEAANKNVFEEESKFVEDVIVTRAFKPLQKILELIHNKANNWKKILIFLGKTGKFELIQASKNWDIKYKQRESITSSDSLLIEVRHLEKL